MSPPSRVDFCRRDGAVDLDAQLVDQQRRKIELQGWTGLRPRLPASRGALGACSQTSPGTTRSRGGRTVDLEHALIAAQHRSAVLKADLDQAEKELGETPRRIEAFDRRKADGDN